MNTEDYSKNSCRSESLSMRRIWRGHGKRRSVGPKNVQEKEMKSLTNFTKQVWGSVDLLLSNDRSTLTNSMDLPALQEAVSEFSGVF